MPDVRRHRLAAEVERVSGRLRELSHARLAGPLGQDAPSVATAGHALAQRLADLAADAEGLPRRPVPRLADHAVGDQVAVTGADLLAVADRVPGPELERVVEELGALRRRLP